MVHKRATLQRGHLTAVCIVSYGRSSLGISPANKNNFPQNHDCESEWHGPSGSEKEGGRAFKSPTCANPKRNLRAGNPKGLRMLAHLTIQLKQRKHPGKLISAVPEGQGAFPLLATCPFPQMCCLSLPLS